MKKEPLKGKIQKFPNYDFDFIDGMFFKQNVKSAVEWLKHRLWMTTDIKTYTDCKITKTIEKAFPDLYKDIENGAKVEYGKNCKLKEGKK